MATLYILFGEFDYIIPPILLSNELESACGSQVSHNLSIVMTSKDFLLELIVRRNPDMSCLSRREYQVII